ncbi:hypothetical protein [Actinoplanes sp. NPDC049599]|uniref:hypothetical protein n=1 Tax=Actinoplanes sp. NPDC049599 TaxID=3363903 RepID=UPI0037B253FD
MTLDLRHRLAALIVEALQVGSRKHEGDVIGELFAAFGIDFGELNALFPAATPGRETALREESARRLAEATPSAAALLNAVMRCGGRFVAMVDEVYARLARHAATTTGTSETFRLERRDVAEEHLTLSPAFVEEARRLAKRLSTIPIGLVDEKAVDSFILSDNGEFYGRWPLGVSDETKGSIRLPDDVLHLAWIQPAVADGLADVIATVQSTVAAADRLITAAAQLLRGYTMKLSTLLDADPEDAAPQLFPAGAERNRLSLLESDLRRFRAGRVLGTRVEEGFISGVEVTSVVGLRDATQPVTIPDRGFDRGTGMSALAGFVAMWREQRWPPRQRRDLEPLLNDPQRLRAWLERLGTACDEAATWLAGDVFQPTGSLPAEELVEIVEEFLNLPLWQRRDLLYEVWVLCATLESAERANWEVELAGLAETAGTWRLTLSPAQDPVARLSRPHEPNLSLEVWHEPKRITGLGLQTPDITVSTVGPTPRDLLVVEAKDRHQMIADLPTRGRRGRPTSAERTALGVARKYAEGLHPVVTWVCNHCDFQAEVDSSANHGDPWTRIHLGAQFRPGNVPSSFGESVEFALRPAGLALGVSAVTLVVDVTGSMAGVRDEIWEVLAAHGDWTSVQEFRAVLYGDHGAHERLLVRKLGPFAELADLADAVAAQPSCDGGDIPEALEDAMSRCRELVADIGPHPLVVITDAPPHSVDECPYGIDFTAEVEALLAAGCRIHVATDWHDDDGWWAAFADVAGIHQQPLSDIARALR